jgi:hypothetical protein
VMNESRNNQAVNAHGVFHATSSIQRPSFSPR